MICFPHYWLFLRGFHKVSVMQSFDISIVVSPNNLLKNSRVDSDSRRNDVHVTSLSYYCLPPYVHSAAKSNPRYSDSSIHWSAQDTCLHSGKAQKHIPGPLQITPWLILNIKIVFFRYRIAAVFLVCCSYFISKKSKRESAMESKRPHSENAT